MSSEKGRKGQRGKNKKIYQKKIRKSEAKSKTRTIKYTKVETDKESKNRKLREKVQNSGKK